VTPTLLTELYGSELGADLPFVAGQPPDSRRAAGHRTSVGPAIEAGI